MLGQGQRVQGRHVVWAQGVRRVHADTVAEAGCLLVRLQKLLDALLARTFGVMEFVGGKRSTAAPACCCQHAAAHIRDHALDGRPSCVSACL